MTELVKKITEYAFEELNLIRVYAKVFSTNEGSIRVLEKAGFIKEGYFRKALVKKWSGDGKGVGDEKTDIVYNFSSYYMSYFLVFV